MSILRPALSIILRIARSLQIDSVYSLRSLDSPQQSSLLLLFLLRLACADRLRSSTNSLHLRCVLLYALYSGFHCITSLQIFEQSFERSFSCAFSLRHRE